MYLNHLCTDERCKIRGGCAHVGPEMQLCYFKVEKELCDILGVPWSQGFELDELLHRIRTRLHQAEGTSPDLAASLAERMRPQTLKVVSDGKDVD
jgi:hypothetical protein